MPTLRALEALVAVVDAGSITEAAARLHMSQPALSHQLAALEREIGAPVVERLPRGVRPTAVGRSVLADARLALAAVDRAVAGGRATARGEGGQLRLACAESLTAGLLAPVLRGWLRRNPLVRLALTETTSADELARLIDSGAVDLAIGPRPSRWTGGTEVVGVEEIVAVLPHDHPLADRDHLTLGQLRDQPLIHYHPDNGLAGWLDAQAARREVEFTVAMRTRQAATAAQLAAAGVGIALVPTTAVSAGLPAALRRLRPELSREIVCLLGTPGDPLVRACTAAIQRRGISIPAAIATKLTP
ncbi:LysR family transcriptional regulator [Nocardia sp. NBC_01503]|uniref:LysR family transcriptional regulator n=1 Tax=Nocardia sp. NBC_01503 TaxID=2975997 RepID=UPI002E7AD275|nr:LysR family transcriptional regulator [Nocardia sp. NBC_01503]WTL29846.1 LysR family transcriptional regulator [Nocardia sp. NBC_01503]